MAKGYTKNNVKTSSIWSIFTCCSTNHNLSATFFGNLSVFSFIIRWMIRQISLYRELEEDIYMDQLDWFVANGHTTTKINLEDNLSD
jgi:hypothetical protein